MRIARQSVCVYLVFIHPHVCQPQRVVSHGVLTSRGPIGPSLPEDVTHSGARDDQELTPTHPDLRTGRPPRIKHETPVRTPSLTVGQNPSHPEGDFQVLSTPDIHSCIVLAEFVKILPVHRKQTTGHGGRPERRQHLGESGWLPATSQLSAT